MKLKRNFNFINCFKKIILNIEGWNRKSIINVEN